MPSLEKLQHWRMDGKTVQISMRMSGDITLKNLKAPEEELKRVCSLALTFEGNQSNSVNACQLIIQKNCDQELPTIDVYLKLN